MSRRYAWVHTHCKNGINVIPIPKYRLATVTIEDMQHILTAFYGANPFYKDQTCWFFFDEIQRVAQWELFIRRILDNKETKEREFRALADAKRLHPQARRSVITWNDEGEEDGVMIRPVWRWWLEGVN